MKLNEQGAGQSTKRILAFPLGNKTIPSSISALVTALRNT